MSGGPDVLPPEPAFPSHGSMGEVAERGMSLRDYFAARAPDEIPEWVPHEKRKPGLTFEAALLEAGIEQLEPAVQTQLREYLSDPCYDAAESYADVAARFQSIWENARSEQQAEASAAARERYFRWRWIYADGMLEARQS